MRLAVHLEPSVHIGSVSCKQCAFVRKSTGRARQARGTGFRYREGIRRFTAAGPSDNGLRPTKRTDRGFFWFARMAKLAIRHFRRFFRLLALEVYSEGARIRRSRRYVPAPPIGAPWSLIRKWLHSTTTAKPNCSPPGLGNRAANPLVTSDLNAPLMLFGSPWRCCRRNHWQALISRSTSNASMPKEFAFSMRARNIR